VRLSRRRLLVAAAAAGAGALALRRDAGRRGRIAGGIVGASHAAGHRLRSRSDQRPDGEVKTGVIIVGSGISGLAAAWKLARSGYDDFRLLDLEPRAGGTAAWGDSPATAYPWGAHYLPLPDQELGTLCDLLTELGVIEGRKPDGAPIFAERALCFAPQERLFLHGRWQEGLFPTLGATKKDLEQYRAFGELMASYRAKRDAAGARAFALPLERSSRDPALLALDRISMAELLARHELDSPRLRWYVDYACRDDYGAGLATTSAYAGVHYYACRALGDSHQVLTWPEGNGWIARRLAARPGRILTGQLVTRVTPGASDVTVDALDTATGRVTRHRAQACILATPKFVTQRLVEGLDASAFTYSPWLVANLHVDRVPEGRGAPPAWDNVLYDTPSLGYITATHQHLDAHPRASVLTYYRPFTGPDPAKERERMLATPWSAWRDTILDELVRAHPDIEERVQRLDVMLWGHAMVRPTPGFLWGGARERALTALPRIYHAHCDASGLPLFEEAFYKGLTAAESALAQLGRPFEKSS
jgi:phytoene dehydrogenase-like protein